MFTKDTWISFQGMINPPVFPETLLDKIKTAHITRAVFISLLSQPLHRIHQILLGWLGIPCSRIQTAVTQQLRHLEGRGSAVEQRPRERMTKHMWGQVLDLRSFGISLHDSLH